MFLLVPAHSCCPRQSPESRKMVVVVVVTSSNLLLSSQFFFTIAKLSAHDATTVHLCPSGALCFIRICNNDIIRPHCSFILQNGQLIRVMWHRCCCLSVGHDHVSCKTG